MQVIQLLNTGAPLPVSESAPFTEKPLKALKSLSKAQAFEQEVSLVLHQRFYPVLVSPLVLRDFRCGQIDISFIKNGCLHIGELKSGQSILSLDQKRRLKRTQQFLTSILDIDARLVLINELPKF